MNIVAFSPVPPRDAVRRMTRRTTRGVTQRTVAPAVWRGWLVAICIASVTIAAFVGDPVAALRADPELAVLLHGMAVLKGMTVVAAIAILMWRFGHPIATRTATGYLVATGLMAGAAVLIWQLTALLPAAAAFHAGLALALFVTWRDNGGLQGRSNP